MGEGTCPNLHTPLSHVHFPPCSARERAGPLYAVLPEMHTRSVVLVQVGLPKLVVFMNKCDMQDDEELLELVEMEVAFCLSDLQVSGAESAITPDHASTHSPGARAAQPARFRWRRHPVRPWFCALRFGSKSLRLAH